MIATMEAGPNRTIPTVYERVQALASADLTPDQQWKGIQDIQMVPGIYEDDPGRLGWATDAPVDTATALMDFGLNPQSSASTLVRAYAIEQGVLTMREAIEEDPEVRLRVRRDIALTYSDLEDGLRDLFDPKLREELQGGHHRDQAPARREQIRAYRDAAVQLAETEGLSLSGTVIPGWDLSMEDGYVTQSWDVPLLPFLLTEYHAGNYSTLHRHNAPLVNYMTPQLLQDGLRAVLDYGTGSASDESREVLAFSRLTRYVREGGAEHKAPLDFLYKLERGERAEYVTALNELYDAGEKLADIFPTIDPEAVAKGFKGLAANALFALQHYFENGRKIEVDVPWYTPGKFVEVREEDPLLIIRTTTQAINILHHAVTSNDMLPVLEVEDGNLSLFRFVDMASNLPPQVSYLGRPANGDQFDPKYEFRGDAASRYRVRLSNDEPVALTNVEQTADTICIRADFDQFGMAIDIGAIADNPFRPGHDDIEVRIGRFFGFGNYLRSGVIGVKTTWNHIRSVHEAVGADEMKFASSVVEQVQGFKRKAVAMTAGPRIVSHSRRLEKIPA